MCTNLSDVVPTQSLSELIDEFTDEVESVLCEDTPDTVESIEFIDEAESMLCENTQDTLDTVESIEVSISLSVPVLLVSSKHMELMGSLSFYVSLPPGPSVSSPSVFTSTMLLKQDNNFFWSFHHVISCIPTHLIYSTFLICALNYKHYLSLSLSSQHLPSLTSPCELCFPSSLFCIKIITASLINTKQDKQRMYSELHQNIHKISSSQTTFFSIISCQNTKAYLHMCVNITCQNRLWLLAEHAHALIFWPCFMQTQHHFSSFLHPWHHHNHHLNCLPGMMYPLYTFPFLHL